jgi:hypothetical protein
MESFDAICGESEIRHCMFHLECVLISKQVTSDVSMSMRNNMMHFTTLCVWRAGLGYLGLLQNQLAVPSLVQKQEIYSI